MRVIVKHPGAAPFTHDIGTSHEALCIALGASPGLCISAHSGGRVWCDDDALCKDPKPQLNLIRPTDSSPIHGTVIVTGSDGPDTCALDDRQVALWMATIALIGVDEFATWRSSALDELAPKVHDLDAAMFEELRRRVAFLNPEVGGPWPRRHA